MNVRAWPGKGGLCVCAVALVTLGADTIHWALLGAEGTGISGLVTGRGTLPWLGGR